MIGSVVPADTPRADHEFVQRERTSFVALIPAEAKGRSCAICGQPEPAHPRPEPANPADDPAVSLAAIGAPEPAEREPEEIAAEIDRQAMARFGPLNADELHRKAQALLGDAHKLLPEPAAGDPLHEIARRYRSGEMKCPHKETISGLALDCLPCLRAAFERLVRMQIEDLEYIRDEQKRLYVDPDNDELGHHGYAVEVLQAAIDRARKYPGCPAPARYGLKGEGR